MHQRTDAELLAVAQGDPSAFGEFYRRHEVALVSFVGGHVRNPEAVVDLVAETFARAYASRNSFDPSRGGGRAWLLGIARHVLIASWQRGKVESELRERLGMDRIAVSEQSLRKVERAVLESEGAVIETWLADLSDEEREAIRRRVLLDDDYSHIAADLECSEAVVRKRVSRGLSRLRRFVLEER